MKKSMIAALLVITFPLMAADFPEIDGWKIASRVKSCTPQTLWEYINGAAEQFLNYGFQELRYCDLESKEYEGVIVTVHLYDMGNPLNAFGMYDLERPEGAETMPVGAEAFLSPPYQALLLKGAFYVKVDAYEGEITEDVGKNLVEAISRALPGSDEYPAALKLLPEEARVRGSEGYARSGYLGLTELNNCVYASYEGKDGTGFPVFVMIGDAEKDWDVLAGKWKVIERKGMAILFRQVPYRGFVGVIRTEEGIIGVAEAESEREMIRRLEALSR